MSGCLQGCNARGYNPRKFLPPHIAALVKKRISKRPRSDVHLVNCIDAMHQGGALVI